MGKILQDIYILHYGIVVFNRVFDETIDAQLFGGLMSAIESFAAELAHGMLSSFDLSKKRFTITKKGELLFIANADKSIKQKKVEQEIKHISDRFIEQFGHVFEKFDGDLSRFNSFEKIIEESLEDPLKRFERNFW